MKSRSACADDKTRHGDIFEIVFPEHHQHIGGWNQVYAVWKWATRRSACGHVYRRRDFPLSGLPAKSVIFPIGIRSCQSHFTFFGLSELAV